MSKQQEIKKTEFAELIDGKLVVVREPILDKDGKQMETKDGRLYFAYVVRGIVKGKEIKADMCPKDMGGYEPLDILFDISPKAALVISDEVMTDDNGRETRYKVYKAEVVDEDGEIYSCPVRPQRDSDKTLLNFLLIELKRSMRASA